MPQDLKRSVQLIEPRPAVLSTVLFRVHEEQQISRLRRMFLAMCLIATLSGIGIFFVVQATIERMSSSGFFRLLSLIATDAAVLAPYWQEYMYSLLETLPIVSFMMLTGLLIVFLRSLQGVLLDAKRVSHLFRIARH